MDLLETLRPLTAAAKKLPTMALMIGTWALLATTFCCSGYAFTPLLQLRTPRFPYGALGVTQTMPEIDIKGSPLYLLNNEVWDARYQELVNFSKQYGHTYVPVEPDIVLEDCRTLAYFCYMCHLFYQYRYRTSSQDRKTTILNNTRIRLLDALGFDWNKNNALWEMRYQQAEAYAQEYEDCNVPRHYIPNPQLGIWIRKQRVLHRQRINEKRKPNSTLSNAQKLGILREERLESLGIDWFPMVNNWMRKWEQLRDFWTAHGHYKCTDPELLIWTRHQRRLCREYQRPLSLKKRRTIGQNWRVGRIPN